MNTSPAQTLREHGVQLHVDPQSGRLRYHAPAGVLTPPLRDLVVEAALQLEERAAIRQFDGGMDRGEAERMAAADLLGEHNSMTVNGMPPLIGSGATAAADTSLSDMLAVE